MSSERSSTSRHDSSARCDGINRQGKRRQKENWKRNGFDATGDADGAVRFFFFFFNAAASGRRAPVCLFDQEKMDLGFWWEDGLWCTRMGPKLEVFERKEMMELMVE